MNPGLWSAWVLLAALVSSCASADPRGEWWGLGPCPAHQDAFCAFKSRPWGEKL
jgi:hypothetical protein